MEIKKNLVKAILCFIIALSSCKKDKESDLIPTLPELPPPPRIASTGTNDTITLGAALNLHPLTSKKDNTSSAWTVNGTTKTADSIYNFVPVEKGDYTIIYTIKNTGGQASVTYQVHVYGKYENGFFIANEGWFGTEPSSVNFYRYGADTIEQDIYKKENPANIIGGSGSNLQFATVYKDKLYLVNKVKGPVVVTDAYSLKETGRTATGNWLAFVGIDDKKGLLSSSAGVYPIDLQALTTGTAIPGITGQVGDMVKAGNYIFVIANTGAVILQGDDYSIAKTIAGVRMGFAITPDGNVWCATSTGYVVKINPATLDVEQTLVSYAIPSNSPWQSTGITASATENAIFIRSGKNIYKHPNSTNTPFYSIASNRMFYGKGIGYDPKTNQLMATTIKGFGTDSKFNDLLFIDPVTGILKKTISYEHIYFPAMPVFH